MKKPYKAAAPMACFALALLLAGCAGPDITDSSDLITTVQPVTPEVLDRRYNRIFKTVNETVSLPDLFAHLGPADENGLAVWASVQGVDERPGNRDWRVVCQDHELTVEQEVFDPAFGVAKLAVTGITPDLLDQSCTLSFRNLQTDIQLPNSLVPAATFSFGAFSCNEPYTTKHEQTGILARDIGLWRRLERRAMGETQVSPDIPTRPDFVLGLGDQVYVDPDANEEGELLSFFTGIRTNQFLIASDDDSLYEAFRILYRYNFGAPHVAETLSKLPSRMMWDDHEIRDGWGSQGDEQGQQAEAYFRIARHAFIAYQLLRNYPVGFFKEQADYDALLERKGALHFPFSHGNRTHFLMLDSRSKRRLRKSDALFVENDKAADQNFALFDKNDRAAVQAWLDQGSNDKGDLYVLTTGLPLFPSRRVESVKGHLRDDLYDSWGSVYNHGARIALASVLSTHFQANPEDRLLVLSGDVHYSAMFNLELNGQVVGQEVVTSGIAHSLPTGARTVNTINNATAPVGAFNVTPFGKIVDSATLAEIIVNGSDPDAAPDVSLIYHVSGTKVQGWTSWVLANTHLINDDTRDTPHWYFPYQNFSKAGDHVKAEAPQGAVRAGSIVRLPYGQIPEPNISRWQAFLSWIDSDRKPTIRSEIQSLSAFCFVPGADYNETYAQDWALTELAKACKPLRP